MEPNTIRAARIWAGYESANAAAKALGIDQSGYNKLENVPEPNPSAPTLRALAKGFGCATDHLLGLADLPARPEQEAS